MSAPFLDQDKHDNFVKVFRRVILFLNKTILIYNFMITIIISETKYNVMIVIIETICHDKIFSAI